jgi:hypothetical protein
MKQRSLMPKLVMLAIAGALLVQPITGTAQKKRSTTRKKTTPYYSVRAGQTMRVRINQNLGSEKARIGDVFTTTLVDPVYSSNGVLLAPQGSIITGKVTQVQRAQKKGTPATLDVQFVSLKLPNGRVHAINGSLADLSNSGGTSDNEGTVTANKTSNRKVKFIGGGAAGGAVIGAIAGGGKGLAIGAGVGAVTGIIAGRIKKGPEVKVPSGTEFGVILNRAFSLPKYVAG